MTVLTSGHDRHSSSIKRRLAIRIGLLVLICVCTLLILINVFVTNMFPEPSTSSVLQPTVSAEPALEGIDATDRGSVVLTSDPLGTARHDIVMRLRLTSVLGLAVVVIFGSFGAYMVAGSALRPIKQVGHLAQRIQARDLSYRIPPLAPSDEVVQLVIALNQMLERLEDGFNRQGRFATDVAHELRSPLATLQTTLDVMDRESALSRSEYATMIGSIRRQVVRMQRQVDDLLLLANDEAIDQIEQIYLGPLIEEVLHRLGDVAKSSDVRLRLHGELSLEVNGSSALLSRAQ